MCSRTLGGFLRQRYAGCSVLLWLAMPQVGDILADIFGRAITP